MWIHIMWDGEPIKISPHSTATVESLEEVKIKLSNNQIIQGMKGCPRPSKIPEISITSSHS